MNYTIIATLGNDLERIIESDFLDSDELKIVEDVIVPLFNACDAYKAFSESMSPDEWFNYQEKTGDPEMCFPYPFFVFDTQRHRDLIAYLTVSGIGINLGIDEVPDVFERKDVINLLKVPE